MKKIYLELPIVKVDPANNWQGKEYATKHFEKGLFIADDGVMYHLVFYQDDWPTMIPIPKEQIEAALVEEARQSGIAEVNGDIDKINDKLDRCLAWMDEVVSKTQAIEDKMISGSGGGVNILDVAKSFAVIQKPELIKELK